LTFYTFCTSVPILEVQIDNLCDLEIAFQVRQYPYFDQAQIVSQGEKCHCRGTHLSLIEMEHHIILYAIFVNQMQVYADK
jgi:hypothetical protein